MRAREASPFVPSIGVLIGWLLISGCHQANDIADRPDATDSRDGGAIAFDATASRDGGAIAFDAESAKDVPSSTTSEACRASPLLVERIPGSRDHSPGGTWWGYNQSKLVRIGDRVLMNVVDNDQPPGRAPRCVVYQKVGDGAWRAGAAVPCSRSGHLVLDQDGALHLIVFEPRDESTPEIHGRLVDHVFPGAGRGEIDSSTREIVVDYASGEEAVNLRIGAAVGADLPAGGRVIAAAFGIVTSAMGNTEQLWVRNPSTGTWSFDLAGRELEHNFFYPFVLVPRWGFALLAVQDDPTGVPGEYRYQQLMYLEKRDGAGHRELLADLTTHPLASERAALLEGSDLFEDAAGRIHVVYKEFLGPDNSALSRVVHLTLERGEWQSGVLDLVHWGVNWVRLLEIDGVLFFIAASWDRLYVGSAGSSVLREIPISPGTSDIYPYVTAPRGGGSRSECVDVLLLNGDPASYPDGANLYLRLHRSMFDALR